VQRKPFQCKENHSSAILESHFSVKRCRRNQFTAKSSYEKTISVQNSAQESHFSANGINKRECAIRIRLSNDQLYFLKRLITFTDKAIDCNDLSKAILVHWFKKANSMQ